MDCHDENYKIPITLAEYPNCFITVRYFYEICVGENTGTGITVNVFDFVIEGGLCQELIDDYTQANNDGTIDEFNYNINVQIWPQINDYILSSQLALSSPITTIQYSISQCQASCFIIKEKRGGGYELIQQNVNCGTECCQRSNTYTANAEGGWDVSTTIWNLPDTFCEENDVDCPHQSVAWTTSCSGRCEELNGF